MSDSAPKSATETTNKWGRIDADRNIYVTDGDTERFIGQWMAGDPADGFAHYVRRYEGLEVEIKLLEDRVAANALSPDDAAKSIASLQEQLAEPQMIGDLRALRTRLEALSPAVEELRARRKADREAKQAEAAEAKNKLIAEAEKISTGSDWRNGTNRLRELLDEWKALPRLSKGADDALWHRFSAARTAFQKRRKAHFNEMDTLREAAQKVKEKLIAEAEALSGSTEWGQTTTAYRRLMQDWKAAGSAPRAVEDKLWKRFRAAQDVFFTARDAANAELDAEFSKNADVKREILVEAEALLPIKDLAAAKAAWAKIAERWEAAGKVPRDQIKDLEGRIRAVEKAVRDAESAEWNRTDPEKSARADDMISKLKAAITETEEAIAKAEAAGDTKKVKSLKENLESRQAFLAMAEKTASDFS